MKLALGTTSKYKVHAIQSVIHELEMDCEIYPVAAESEISDQPHSKDETKNGAVNRAKNAIKLVDDADLGLGVEFGYEPFEDDKYHMVCWAAVVTRSGKVYTEHSSSLELPKVLSDALLEDKDMGDLFDEKFRDQQRTTIADEFFITFIRKRQPIKESARNVLLKYMFETKY